MIVYHAYHKEKPSFYIGKTEKTLDHRRRQHENESRYNRANSIFHKAIRKYGSDMFEWKILEICDTLDELNAAEIRWIALARECGHKLYNISDGGTGGDVGGSKYWKENGLRPDMKKKISKTLKEYFKTHDSLMKGITGIDHPCYGYRHTDEAKEKVRRSKLGIPRSEETKCKLREANIGKILSIETKAKIAIHSKGSNNNSARKIICVTTREVFEYAKLAAIKYDTDLSSIIKCCKGKLKTAKGKIYEYYK